MKVPLHNLNKAFDHRIRLGIMAILAVQDHIDFNNLKLYLDVTDGNLATHLKTLEKEKFITVEKKFINRKPNTKYSITDEGRLAFENHLHILEALIKNQKRK